MAISNYLQKCEYKLGGLKPHIYLIHKDELTVKIKANGVKVSFNHIKKGKDEDDKEIDIIPRYIRLKVHYVYIIKKKHSLQNIDLIQHLKLQLMSYIKNHSFMV